MPNARDDQAMRSRPSPCATSFKRRTKCITAQRVELVHLSACADFTANPAIRRRPGTDPGARALHAIASGKGELAFLGNTLERFARTLDTILAVVPFGRQQADHLVGAGGSRTRHVARSEIDSRSNRELVLQRPLHTRI